MSSDYATCAHFEESHPDTRATLGLAPERTHRPGWKATLTALGAIGLLVVATALWIAASSDRAPSPSSMALVPVLIETPITPTVAQAATLAATTTRTPIVEASCTATAAPTISPMPASTPTPTVTTATETPRPSHTPFMATPTPTVERRVFKTPRLLSPASGSTVHARTELRWESVGALEGDEWYDVQVWKDSELPHGVAWSKENRWAMPRDFPQSRYQWRVVVIRGRDGKWMADLSLPSDSWTLEYQ